jgi:shikimate kinase / 3-dehydroquinate synthase
MHSIDSLQNKNIILTGFMGTGKTTIGRLLADRLDRRFVDMDVLLESHFGKPISTVFAAEGESVFRDAERALCAQLAQEQGLVISTGGGALVDPANQTTLGQTGVLLCLTATVDEILTRIEAAEDRPLLGERSARRQRITTLLHTRRDAYGTISHQVDTTSRTPEAIIEQVLTALAADAEAPGMSVLPVRTPDGQYDICLGDGLLHHAGRLLGNRGLRTGPAAIVTNSMVAEYHAETLADSLRAAGFEPHLCLAPEGEQHKTLATVTTLYDQFLAAKLDRNSPIIALGGGVIGDMTGFAAATYLRGAPFVQIPTTLLAMVDASVGGKTGVDLPQGKNLVGAFKQPAAVIIDTAVLRSLPPAEFASGMAEVIKHGIIGAPTLFETLEAGLPHPEGPRHKHLVADAVRVKIAVVEEDPFEQGRRAILNLGHTFGHAIELVSNFTIRHGEGVALGTIAATHLAAALGRCDPALVDRVTQVMDRHRLPVELPGYDVGAIMAAMGHDKKRAGKTLRFIIPQALGDVVIIDDPGVAWVRDALSRVLGKGVGQ